jgi:hypothetical protein
MGQDRRTAGVARFRASTLSEQTNLEIWTNFKMWTDNKKTDKK